MKNAINSGYSVHWKQAPPLEYDYAKNETWDLVSRPHEVNMVVHSQK